MILQSLVRCYDSLAAQGTLKRPGWSAVKVQWGLRLTADGQVSSVEMLGAANDKGKLLPRMMFLHACQAHQRQGRQLPLRQRQVSAGHHQ